MMDALNEALKKLKSKGLEGSLNISLNPTADLKQSHVPDADPQPPEAGDGMIEDNMDVKTENEQDDSEAKDDSAYKKYAPSNTPLGRKAKDMAKGK